MTRRGETRNEIESEFSIEQRREFAKQVLRIFIKTGEFARQSQERVRALPDKDQSDIHGRALTEVDTAIQESVTKALIQKYPDLAIWGEEDQRFVGSNVLSTDEPKRVYLLDPIDGTRLYMDGLNIYSTVGSLLYKGERMVSTVHVPAERQFYIGIEGQGAFAVAEDGVDRQEDWQELKLQGTSNIIFLGPREIDASIIRRIENEGFVIKDIHNNYDNGNNILDNKPWDVVWHSILNDKTAGSLDWRPPAIDQGAVAHIVRLAGGSISGMNGELVSNTVHPPYNNLTNGLVMARDTETHRRLLRAIQG